VRNLILTTTQDLLSHNTSTTNAPLTLDEIAACAGIPLAHLRAYYTSVYAITADLRHPPALEQTNAPSSTRGT
jgi:hypothetical protein